MTELAGQIAFIFFHFKETWLNMMSMAFFFYLFLSVSSINVSSGFA